VPPARLQPSYKPKDYIVIFAYKVSAVTTNLKNAFKNLVNKLEWKRPPGKRSGRWAHIKLDIKKQGGCGLDPSAHQNDQ
jgi:hypothetical protein